LLTYKSDAHPERGLAETSAARSGRCRDRDAASPGSAHEGPGLARHKRQTSVFMLFRRNVSVRAQSLEGLYF